MDSNDLVGFFTIASSSYAFGGNTWVPSAMFVGSIPKVRKSPKVRVRVQMTESTVEQTPIPNDPNYRKFDF